MRYGEGYYEGSDSNYSVFGGYNSIRMKVCRYFVFRKALSIIKRHKKSGSLLDVGCAYGFWADFTNRSGFSSSGCDISGFAVSRARKLFPHISFFTANIERKIDRGNMFDVVTAMDVLEHCREIDSALSEIKKVMKPDGVLLATVPDIDYFSMERDKDETHVWYLNLSGWTSVFRRNGFAVVGSWIYPRVFSQIRPEWCVRFILLKKELNAQAAIPISAASP